MPGPINLQISDHACKMPVNRAASEANKMRPTSKLIQMEQIFRKVLESLWRGKVETRERPYSVNQRRPHISEINPAQKSSNKTDFYCGLNERRRQLRHEIRAERHAKNLRICHCGGGGGGEAVYYREREQRG